MFYLEPAQMKNRKDELPWLSDSHLTCPSYFPIAKVHAHVASKLNLGDSIEITCFNGEEHHVLDDAILQKSMMNLPGEDHWCGGMF